jgi:hypothetical protein
MPVFQDNGSFKIWALLSGTYALTVTASKSNADLISALCFAYGAGRQDGLFLFRSGQGQRYARIAAKRLPF